jgi:hypothetical protein
MAQPMERKERQPASPVLSPQQARVILRQQSQEHLPPALEHHVDPPELAKELAQLRALIRKAGKTKMIVEGFKLTPTMARACLALRQKKNRRVVPSKVAMLRTILLEGRFRAVELMRFDWDGDFRDGQHRTEAVASSGVTIEVDMQFGMDPKDFQFIDAGQRRTGSQFLDLDGVKSANEIAAIVRLKHRIEHQGAVLDDHAVFLKGKEIADDLMVRALAAAWRLRTSQKVIASAAALAYRLIASQSKRAPSIDEFWDRLVIGDEIKTTNPVFKLRAKFTRTARDKARKGHQYLTQTQHAAWIIRAWNAWSQGDTAVDFTWTDQNGLPIVK